MTVEVTGSKFSKIYTFSTGMFYSSSCWFVSHLFEAFLVVLSHSCFLTNIPSNSPSGCSAINKQSVRQKIQQISPPNMHTRRTINKHKIRK